MRLRRALTLFLLVVIPLLGGSGCKNKSESDTLHLTIIHTNDVEGAVNPCECTVSPSGGARRSATVIKALREEYPGLLLVDSGDALFGSNVSDATTGLAQIAVMNTLGYDAAVLGDRDFIYGLWALENAIHEANFPYLSANIVMSEDGRAFTQASTLIEKDGVRIAVFGLTTPTVQKVWEANPEMKRKLDFLDPIQTAREIVPELRKNADIVVLLSHLGSEVDRQLARKVPGISAIIGGHSREMIDPPEMLENSIPMAQMGYDGDPLGLLLLEVDDAGQTVSAEGSSVRLSSDIPSDPEMSALVVHYQALAVFSGDLPVELGLTPEFPLDVRKSSREIKQAYLAALAFPELLEKEDFPGKTTGKENENLLDCFIDKNEASNPGLSFSKSAITEPACVANALSLIRKASLITQQNPVLPFYLVDPGETQ